jgi:hypothetical protein
MDPTQTWYGARLIFEAVHPTEPALASVFEERIILVQAPTEAEARRKAETYGRAEQDSYRNGYGDPVDWVFREVLDLTELLHKEFHDLSEVFYCFLDAHQVAALREPTSLD